MPNKKRGIHNGTRSGRGRLISPHVSAKVSPTMNTAVESGQSLSRKERASVTREPEGSF